MIETTTNEPSEFPPELEKAIHEGYLPFFGYYAKKAVKMGMAKKVSDARLDGFPVFESEHKESEHVSSVVLIEELWNDFLSKFNKEDGGLVTTPTQSLFDAASMRAQGYPTDSEVMMPGSVSVHIMRRLYEACVDYESRPEHPALCAGMNGRGWNTMVWHVQTTEHRS